MLDVLFTISIAFSFFALQIQRPKTGRRKILFTSCKHQLTCVCFSYIKDWKSLRARNMTNLSRTTRAWHKQMVCTAYVWSEWTEEWSNEISKWLRGFSLTRPVKWKISYVLGMLMFGLKRKWEKDCEGPFISYIIGALEKTLSKEMPLEGFFWLICGIVLS